MLPSIEHPTYKVTIPSTGKEVSFRPFLSKEQKVLLMLMEEVKDFEDTEEGRRKASEKVFDSVKNILNNCIMDDVDIAKLCGFDMEKIFLAIRSKSIGEVQELKYRCKNEVEGETCNGSIPVEINLEDIDVEGDTSVQARTIWVTDDIGFVLSFPTIEISESLMKENLSQVEYFYKCIAHCIEYAFQGEEVHETDALEKEDIEQWFEEMPMEVLERVKDFFNNLPRIRHEQKVQCPKCEVEDTIVVEGLESFFS